MASKTISKEEQTLNQHMEELRERMRVLQNDRNSNIEVLESTKNANKDEIKRLREENKELRQKYAALQRAVASEEGGIDDQQKLEIEVERLRKNYDDVRLINVKNRKVLESLRDNVRDLELDSQRPHMEDNSQTRAIRSLESKLDKAMIKYNEAQSIRKTYEQIVRRLKEERVGFDNQLAAVERTLNAKHRDYEELVLLAGEANHERELTLGELDRVRSGYEEERKRRERDLRERHQVVQLRRQMVERLKQREKLRNQLGCGDLASSSKFNSSLPSNKLSTSNLSPTQGGAGGSGIHAVKTLLTSEKIEARNKIDIFENAFRSIKEATGVSDVNEVIQKILSQESTTESLIALTKDNQQKIEALMDQRKKLKGLVEELKYSGGGGGAGGAGGGATGHRRKLVDDHEDQLANSLARLERSRLKYDRLSKLLISMKAGVSHLQGKLEVVREELLGGGGGGSASSSSSSSGLGGAGGGAAGGGGGKRLELTDETIIEVLRECESVISHILKRNRAGEDAQRKEKMLNPSLSSSSSSTLRPSASFSSSASTSSFFDTFSSSSSSSSSSLEEAMLVTRPYNQRIDLSFDLDGEEDEGEGGRGGLGIDLGESGGMGGGGLGFIGGFGGGDGDDDEITREKVKRASNQLILANEKKKRRPKKGASGGDRNNHSSSSNSLLPSASSSGVDFSSSSNSLLGGGRSGGGERDRLGSPLPPIK